MKIDRTGLAAGVAPDACTLEAEILTALLLVRRSGDCREGDGYGKQLVAAILRAVAESDMLQRHLADDDADYAAMVGDAAAACVNFASEIDDVAQMAQESLQPMSQLEAEIANALAMVPSDTVLAALYTDAGDRMRVRRRGLISATLDAVFRHGYKKIPIDADGSVAVMSQPDAFSELAYARLDFLHDQTLLDFGRTAELVLRPVGRETVTKRQTISAKRKVLIQWLAAIELWEEGKDIGFTTQEELMAFAAQHTGRESGSIKTARSDLENGRKCSKAELVLYHDLIDHDLIERARSISQREQGRKTPFELLLPVVVGIAGAAYKKSASSVDES